MSQQQETIDSFWIFDNACYIPGAQAILFETETSAKFNEPKLDFDDVDGFRVPQWGPDNLLPQRVLDKIDRAEIVGTNANFNWQVGFGLGPKLVKLIRDRKNNRVVDYYEITKGKEFDWCERNDISLYLMETLTDLSYFHNGFPIVVFDKELNSIETLRHREAAFCRWGVDKNGEIKYMLYRGDWEEKKDEMIDYLVLDEYKAFQSLKDFQTYYKGKQKPKRAFCYPIYMPSPGRPYYSYPTWYSVFRSGWYDNIISIPALKKAILKYKLGVRHIIYVSPKYFQDKEKQAGIQPSDIKGRKELRDQLVNDINNVLTGEQNAGKSIMSIKELVPSGSSATEEKYITIETIKNDIEGGEYVTDYETGANVISYAMGVHPSLVGAVPGKNSNSLSGSNIREIFMMKQALTFPMVDRALRPFSLIRKFNNWDEDITIAVPEYVFTTLDQNKSGKQESTNAIVQ